MIVITIPEWLAWLLVVLIAAQTVLQIALAILRVKIDRAQNALDAKLQKLGIRT